MSEVIKWLLVAGIFALLGWGASKVGGWLIDDLLGESAKTRDRRVKRS